LHHPDVICGEVGDNDGEAMSVMQRRLRGHILWMNFAASSMRVLSTRREGVDDDARVLFGCVAVRVCRGNDIHTFVEVIQALNAPSSSPNAIPFRGVGSIGKIRGKGWKGRSLTNYLVNKHPSKLAEDLAANPSMKNVTMTDATTLPETSPCPERPAVERQPPRKAVSCCLETAFEWHHEWGTDELDQPLWISLKSDSSKRVA
jgi:hypothetical protein